MSNFQTHWSKQRQGETPQPGQLEELIGNSGTFAFDPVMSCVLTEGLGQGLGQNLCPWLGQEPGSSGWNLS